MNKCGEYPKGRLVVVGSGIKAGAHLTKEAIGCISSADVVLHLVADPITTRLIEELNLNAETLLSFYKSGKSRSQSYQAMVNRIVDATKQGHYVCVVFYGHPGVFAYPGHEAIRILKQDGFDAVMLPAVSAEDCLFADLGIDPARYGCQSFEATDFILNERVYDPRSLLILWQIGVLGHGTFQARGYDNSRIPVLLENLRRHYSAEHWAVLYEASQYVLCSPKIERIALANLVTANLSPITTLVLFPAKPTVARVKSLEALGLDEEHLLKEVR